MTELQAKLFSMADENYRAFTAPLIPTVSPERIIGVRVPELKKLARELSDGKEAEELMSGLPHFYLEENHLHGFLINLTRDFDLCIARLNGFLPFVDNWATCDGIRPPILKKHLPGLLPHIRCWLHAPGVYTRRFAMEMLMCHCLDGQSFSPEYPLWVAETASEEYYLQMMQAWYFATALAKQWDAVFPLLEQGLLSPEVQSRTLQKATESRRITEEQRSALRALRHPR